jgi:hypothetical protein
MYFTYHLTTQNEALSYEHSTRRYEYNCVLHAGNQVVVRILLEEGKTQQRTVLVIFSVAFITPRPACGLGYVCDC